MYNRYIPQPDGSFRRSRQPDADRNDPPPQRQQPQPQLPPDQACTPPEKTQEEPPIRCNPHCGRPNSPRSNRPTPPISKNPPPQGKEGGDFFGVGRFLRQLLPRDFDTEDLLVVILLLLISGEGGEDSNSALLTLGLYLFL